MTKLGDFIQKINREYSQTCPNDIKAELEVINGQILATILQRELAHNDMNYHEHHNSMLAVREAKIDTLFAEQQATNDEIVREELFRRKADSERKINNCREKAAGNQQVFELMGRRRKLLKARKRVILEEWRRISGLEGAGEGSH